MNIAFGKLALRYSGRDLEAMKAVASSAKARSKEFQTAVYYVQRTKLEEDKEVSRHLDTLPTTMPKQNL